MDVIHAECWKIGLYLCMAIRMGVVADESLWMVGMLCMVQTEATSAF